MSCINNYFDVFDQVNYFISKILSCVYLIVHVQCSGIVNVYSLCSC